MVFSIAPLHIFSRFILREALSKGSFFWFDMKTAILIDGTFFLKRYASLKKVKIMDCTPKKIADDIDAIICGFAAEYEAKVYRSFFYDCKPFNERSTNPISKKCIDFSKTVEFEFRNQLFQNLKKKRKMALRLGSLSMGGWKLKNNKNFLQSLGEKEITAEDVIPDFKQKGVDMKIGLDISSLAYKKLVDQIILIAGDSDFVPASKLARIEGIDFVLDSMNNHIKDELMEHIDGLSSVCVKYLKKS